MKPERNYDKEYQYDTFAEILKSFALFLIGFIIMATSFCYILTLMGGL